LGPTVQLASSRLLEIGPKTLANFSIDVFAAAKPELHALRTRRVAGRSEPKRQNLFATAHGKALFALLLDTEPNRFNSRDAQPCVEPDGPGGRGREAEAAL